MRGEIRFRRFELRCSHVDGGICVFSGNFATNSISIDPNDGFNLFFSVLLIFMQETL